MPAPLSARSLSGISAALLCLAVAWIHVQDQGGFPGDKTPTYVGIGYYLLEIAGVVAAVMLVMPRTRIASSSWLLAVGVAIGPLLGYVLSRGPGLPDYDDDKGNWTEPLGLVSLGVEGVLLVLAVAALLSARSAAGSQRPEPRRTERAEASRVR